MGVIAVYATVAFCSQTLNSQTIGDKLRSFSEQHWYASLPWVNHNGKGGNMQAYDTDLDGKPDFTEIYLNGKFKNYAVYDFKTKILYLDRDCDRRIDEIVEDAIKYKVGDFAPDCEVV